MSIEQLISPVPTVLSTDSVNTALHLMEEFHLSQLPIVDDDIFQGLILESDLLERESMESTISQEGLQHYRPAVLGTDHPYRALKLSHDLDLDVVPVIDKENKYKGSITKRELIKYFTELGSLQIPGGVIVLEVAMRDYSLSEIARICENEETVILNLQVHTNPETQMMEITIKTNREDLSAVLRSFERYEYNVREIYGAITENENTIDRYKLLMNYLNM